MQAINYLTFHCSASRPKAAQTQTAKDINAMHKARGWSGIGYHFFVRTDGTREVGRSLATVGAHVGGHNTGNIGICYAGGLDANGNAADTRTDAQKTELRKLRDELVKKYPNLSKPGRIKGHRDWSPDLDKDGVVEKHEWMKECPCFDVATEL